MGNRCLWTRRRALPIAHRPPAFCRWYDLRNCPHGFGNAAAATTPVESESRSRPCDDLLEVPREGSGAPLLVRSRARRRLGTLAKARTNSGAADQPLHTRKEMGATKSNQRGAGGITGRPCCGGGRNDLEERPCPPSSHHNR